MGWFVDFKCSYCRYEEIGLGVGRGQHPFPFLALFSCANCKSIGSTWVDENKVPRCGACYHEGVTLLADDVRRVDCPKCGEPAIITRGEGVWE